MERKKFSLVRLLKKSVKIFLTVLYFTFILVLLFGTAIAGVLTILPAEASKVNFIGYYSLCAFVPISTAILFSITIIGLVLLLKFRKYLTKKSRNSIVNLQYETILN